MLSYLAAASARCLVSLERDHGSGIDITVMIAMRHRGSELGSAQRWLVAHRAGLYTRCNVQSLQRTVLSLVLMSR